MSAGKVHTLFGIVLFHLTIEISLYLEVLSINYNTEDECDECHKAKMHPECEASTSQGTTLCTHIHTQAI